MIPHSPHMVSLYTCPVSDLVDLIHVGSGRLIYRVPEGEFRVDVGSDRLACLAHSQQCVSCEKVGTVFSIDAPRKQPEHPRNPYEEPHLNLYTAHGILMTVDHIVPKSKGGSDDLSNLQTMCAVCNQKKGNGDQNGRYSHHEIKSFVMQKFSPVDVPCRPDFVPCAQFQIAEVSQKLSGIGEKVIIEVVDDYFYISPTRIHQVFDGQKACFICGRVPSFAVVGREKYGTSNPLFLVVSKDGVPFRRVQRPEIITAEGYPYLDCACEECKPSPLVQKLREEHHGLPNA